MAGWASARIEMRSLRLRAIATRLSRYLLMSHVSGLNPRGVSRNYRSLTVDGLMQA